MGKRLLAIGALVFCLGFTVAGALALWPDEQNGGSAPEDTEAADRTVIGDGVEVPDPVGDAAAAAGGAVGAAGALASGELEPPPGSGPFALEPAEEPYPVQPRLKRPPAAGVLFDVDTGEVLWARKPAVERPIASLTKMMTALLIAEGHRPGERVLIPPKAPRVEGSRIGLLRAGRKVPLGGLFLGLIMVSGNDAAVALAQHDAGSIAAFVRRMNARAVELGLGCTRFAGPAGLQDRGNASCAYDVAAMARAALADRWVSSVTARPSAEVPFPVKGGRLSLANNHYFVQRGIAGLPKARVTGVKTGLTDRAGRCYVTTARLGKRHLGVVLLDSEDPIRQVPQLLRAGFAAG